MSDFDAIKETLFDYFNGYQAKDRALLENAFAVEIANLMGYMKNDKGELELFTIPLTELIETWVAPDYSPHKFGEGRILAIDIFSDVGATALFDCGGRFTDTFQMVEKDGKWLIANKFFVDQ